MYNHSSDKSKVETQCIASLLFFPCNFVLFVAKKYHTTINPRNQRLSFQNIKFYNMRRVIIALVCVFYLSGNVLAQSGFFVRNSNIEKWYIESSNLETEVKKVMNLPEFQEVTKGKMKIEELLPSFHFIDFDNNGTLDLLFDGKILNVFHTFIFYKKNDGYVVSIGEKGSIICANLPREDNGLNFSIWKEGCCGDNINTFTQYVCISTNNTSYFNVASKSLIYRRTILPSNRNAKPVSFKIAKEKVGYLRVEPAVDDEKMIGGQTSWKGNALGMYPPGATGTIYAETKDSKGQFWYFVRMNNESGVYIHSNRFGTDDAKKFSGDENLETYFTYGWIHSKDVIVDGE